MSAIAEEKKASSSRPDLEYILDRLGDGRDDCLTTISTFGVMTQIHDESFKELCDVVDQVSNSIRAVSSLPVPLSTIVSSVSSYLSFQERKWRLLNPSERLEITFRAKGTTGAVVPADDLSAVPEAVLDRYLKLSAPTCTIEDEVHVYKFVHKGSLPPAYRSAKTVVLRALKAGTFDPAKGKTALSADTKKAETLATERDDSPEPSTPQELASELLEDFRKLVEKAQSHLYSGLPMRAFYMAVVTFNGALKNADPEQYEQLYQKYNELKTKKDQDSSGE